MFASREKRTHSSLVVASLYQGGSNIDSVLSTFTCSVGDSGELRVLRDAGSQSNFICEHLLAAFSHEILQDNICLEVNGINESKFYFSKLVKISLGFGKEYKSVELLTLLELVFFFLCLNFQLLCLHL